MKYLFIILSLSISSAVAERGRTKEGVKKQFANQVKPMHDLFVEPSKLNATFVSSGTDMNKFYELLNLIQNTLKM